MPYPKSLIETWLVAELADPARTKTAAVRDLNKACGTRYTVHRINELTRGLNDATPGARQNLPRAVRQYMLARALPLALAAEGIHGDRLTAAQWRRLIASIS